MGYANSEWKPGTVASSGGGTTVVANSTLSGNESNLTSLTVGSTLYKIEISTTTTYRLNFK